MPPGLGGGVGPGRSSWDFLGRGLRRPLWALRPLLPGGLRATRTATPRPPPGFPLRAGPCSLPGAGHRGQGPGNLGRVRLGPATEAGSRLRRQPPGREGMSAQAPLPRFAASGASGTPRLVDTSYVPGLAPDRIPGARLGLPPWAFPGHLVPTSARSSQQPFKGSIAMAGLGVTGGGERASLPRRPRTGLNEALCAHLRPCVCPGRDPRRPAGIRVGAAECEMPPRAGP